MFKTYYRTYDIATGTLGVKIFYKQIYTTHELDFPCIDLGTIEYGYEDKDELTFYPNIVRLKFRDDERKNYDLLNFAFGETPSGNYFQNHGIELSLDGVVYFKGYIDKGTLDYHEKTRHLSFECVDVSLDLKNLKVEGAPGDWAGGIPDIHYVYKKVFPNLQYTCTNNLQTYLSSNYNGLFLSHNWRFNGEGNIGNPSFSRSWDLSIDPDGWKSVAIWRQDMMSTSEYYSDYIKTFARETGMSIGSTGYNKVYLIKRFVRPGNVVTRNLNSLIRNDNLKKQVFLRNVMGVRNINQIDNNVFNIQGTVNLVNPLDPLSDPENSDHIIDMKTMLSRTVPHGQAATFRIHKDGVTLHVLNGIYDPDISSGWDEIGSILTRWTFLARNRPKSRFEIELGGIDYGMHEYFSLALSGNVSLVLRPIKLVIDLLRNKTFMTAIEISM